MDIELGLVTSSFIDLCVPGRRGRVGAGEYLSVQHQRIRQQLSAGIDGLWGFALSIFNASLATRGPLTDVSANEDDGSWRKKSCLR